MQTDRSSESRHGRLRPEALFAIATLLSPLCAQQTLYGENCQPIPAPNGYPELLVAIPTNPVKMGITAKDVVDTAKKWGRGIDGTRKWMKILAREMAGKRSTVLVQQFLIGKHEITNADYAVYVKKRHPNVRFPFHWWKQESINAVRQKWAKDGRGRFKPKDYWQDNWRDLLTDWEIPKGKETHPVGYITLDDAKRYCSWAGVRLPYEVEWQLALQGPTKKPMRYIWGDKWDSRSSSSLCNLRRRAAGSWTKTRSHYGIDDMLGGVWEYTQSPLTLYPGCMQEFRDLDKTFKKTLKKKERMILPRPVADGRYVVRGGSYTSGGQIQVVMRSSTRRPINDDETVEDIGFRIAKSLRPAFDATMGRASFDYDTDQLGGFELDLPTRLEQRDGTAIVKEYEQRGIERWSIKDGSIAGYHMISFVPVRAIESVDQSKVKTAKDFQKIAANRCGEGATGIPIAVLMSTEAFSVAQGINKWGDLPSGDYTISYRGKGLPRELQIALNDGKSILKRNKGERPKADAKPEPEKADDKKSKKKSSKKSKKKKDEAKQEEKKDPFPILDRFGIADELTIKYPKERPKMLLIQPGNLEIPAKQNVLLWRNSAGNYVAWSEYKPSIRTAGVGQSKPQLKIDMSRNSLTYKGGPQTSRRGQRVEFQIDIKVQEPLGQNTWVTERDPEIKEPKIAPAEVRASPKKK